ncbi:hypothetical protein FLACOL_01584 [Flavobacterium columnare]|uniref:Uncharacterized protein n=2 Tax=Flavobacterium TaxID=237 RepID=A0ABW8PKK2_9FLAO|nr:hypothetical protein [Flavobacterium columnare]SPE77588.1 hypothetical protein FLACOL_01584 [Flavobacterium columnare]
MQISITKAKKILETDFENLTDEDVKVIRDMLIKVGTIASIKYQEEKDEKSSNVSSSING